MWPVLRICRGTMHLENIALHLVCVRLTLNCCSFPVSAHVSVLAASLLPLQLFGTPFLWPFVVVSLLKIRLDVLWRFFGDCCKRFLLPMCPTNQHCQTTEANDSVCERHL